MRPLLLALQVGWLCGALAAEESCEGRCDKGFDALKKCQCDELCVYYQSCCVDYATTCKTKVTRGDVFAQPDDDYVDTYDDILNATALYAAEPTATYVEPSTLYFSYDYSVGTEEPALPSSEPCTDVPEEEETLCSGQPFDAFTSVKNGSIYAFRGKYFYELDETSAMPGYPKLIREVWGIEGPIDAAFTRINCEGKTYVFQGSQYWRFDDGVLEQDFPRNISAGFKGIPDNIDAAFALPAQSFFSSERVYFFKGMRYWSYDFAHQPSRQECEETSPSLVFGHYALMQDDSWEEVFQLLFGGSRRSGTSRSRYISRDWKGLPSHLDAAIVGRIHVVESPPKHRSAKKSSRRHRKKYRSRRRWGRWNRRSWQWQDTPSSESFETDWLLDEATHCQPVQSIYFFKGDKYYRLNLHSKRVDSVYPRYPRSIAKYWLGCTANEKPF